MPSWYGMVSRLKDACRARIMFEIIHIFINVHHCLIIIIHHSHQWNFYRNSLEMSWNVFQLKIPPPMPLSTDVACWVVNGANVEIPSACSCMHQNLTCLHKTHTFTAWEGFKAQGRMSCLHNIWYCPRFHRRSSLFHCCHSSFPSMECLSKLSWNVMELIPIKIPTTNATIH